MHAWVTQSISRSVSRKSSDSRRTAEMPGMTSVPPPVVILKPRLCSEPRGRCARPEMISASLGSAIRHMARNISTAIRMAMIPSVIAVIATADRNSGIECPPCPSDRADYDGTGREVLDHDDARPPRDRLPGVGGVRVERLAATTDRDHDLTQVSWRDRSRHPAGSADHLLRDHVPHHLPPSKTPRANAVVAVRLPISETGWARRSATARPTR